MCLKIQTFLAKNQSLFESIWSLIEICTYTQKGFENPKSKFLGKGHMCSIVFFLAISPMESSMKSHWFQQSYALFDISHLHLPDSNQEWRNFDKYSSLQIPE